MCPVYVMLTLPDAQSMRCRANEMPSLCELTLPDAHAVYVSSLSQMPSLCDAHSPRCQVYVMPTLPDAQSM